MKRSLWMSLLPLVLACGCSTHTTVAYRTAIRISPAAEAGQYNVETRVVRQTIRHSASPFHSRTSTHSDVIPAPTVMCRPAESARAFVAADNRGEALSLDAYVARTGEGKESVCTLTIRQQGRVVSSAEVRVPPLSP